MTLRCLGFGQKQGSSCLAAGQLPQDVRCKELLQLIVGFSLGQTDAKLRRAIKLSEPGSYVQVAKASSTQGIANSTGVPWTSSCPKQPRRQSCHFLVV